MGNNKKRKAFSRLLVSIECDLSDLIKVEDVLINNQFIGIKQSGILKYRAF